MSDELVNRNDQSDEDWETVEVDVARPLGTVISIRFPADVAEQIFEQARRRGLSTSAFVREATECHLEAAWAGRASRELTVSSNDTSVVFYAGRSVMGSSVGTATTWPPVEEFAGTI